MDLSHYAFDALHSDSDLDLLGAVGKVLKH